MATRPAVFSSRKIERGTFDSVAFRFIAAGGHPDHDTLATFRRRFLDELAGIFVQVLELAQEMKLLKLGTISLDGTRFTPMPHATARCRMDTSRSSKRISKPRYRSCWPWRSRLTGRTFPTA